MREDLAEEGTLLDRVRECVCLSELIRKFVRYSPVLLEPVLPSLRDSVAMGLPVPATDVAG